MHQIFYKRLIANATLVVGALIFVSISGCSGYQSSSTPDFSGYPAGTERKQVFFDYFEPIIEKENRRISAQRAELMEIVSSAEQLSWWDNYRLEKIAAEYEVHDFSPDDEEHIKMLVRRVDVIPPSMALAQAANESAWGTSRFAQQGNNFFGQWCYEKGCGLVPKERDTGARHEVARFDSAEMSVRSYMNNLNTHRQYTQLRILRAQLRTKQQSIEGLVLIKGLKGYSERGEDYIQELRSMIRQNKLQELDS